MKVSIITPTWNRGFALEKMMASVRSQTCLPCEHILVDNLSTDNTEQVIQNYREQSSYPVIYLREKDTGIYDAMNKGIAQASGAALYFLNDDDVFFSETSLALLLKVLVSTESEFVFGDVVVKNAQTGKERRRNHRQMNRFTLAEKSICQQASLVARTALQKVGIFDASLRAAGDYDWAMRALVMNRLQAAYLRAPVAIFSTGGISSDPLFKKQFEEEMQKVRERYLSSRDLLQAKRYRKTWRKIPYGLRWMPGATREDHFRLISLYPLAGHLLPDPLAWLEF